MGVAAQVAVNAVALSATYLLVALGLILLFGGLGIPQLALGKMLYIAALAGFAVVDAGGSVWLGVGAGVVAAALVSVGLYVIPFATLARKGDQLSMLLAAFGLMTLIGNGGDAVFGSSPRRYALPFSQVFQAGPARVTQLQVIIVVSSMVLWALLAYALHATAWGRQIRAMGEDMTTAKLLGVRVSRVALIAFGIAGALAGVAGIAIASLYSASPDSDIAPLLVAFVAVVVGGAGSTTGAALTCLAIAGVQSGTGVMGWSGWQDAIVYGALLILLLARPAGLFHTSGERA